MIRATIRNKAHFALAALLALALMNMALGHHILGKMNAVSQTVVSSSELYRLVKRVRSTVANPRATDPAVQPTLFEPLDAEVSGRNMAEEPVPGLATENSQLHLLWDDMAREWLAMKADYQAMRRNGAVPEAEALARLDNAAADLEASIGAVQYLAARELDEVYARLRYVALLIGAIDVAVIAFLLVGLRRQVLDPLSRLAQAAREYSAEDYGRQFANEVPNEIGDLSRALDRSATRVRSLVASVRSNAELRSQAEEKFRGLVEHAGVGVYLLQGSRYLYVNSRFAELFGTTPARLYADHSATDLIDEFDRARVESLIQACLRGEHATLHYECRALRADGERIECEVFGTRTEHAGAPAVIGTLIDQTVRRRSEDRLRRLSRAIEQSQATVVITDAHGLIEYVNPQFSRLTGYSVDEAIGQSPSIIKSGFTPRAVYQELWASISAGGEWSGEILNRKKSGELFWEHMVVSSVRGTDGSITHFVAVKEDITARKLAERELQRVNRTLKVLSESNQALVHAVDEHSLLFATCRNIVEIGGYRLAFVGKPIDAEAREVCVAVQFGDDDGYLASRDDRARGAGPGGIAIRSGEIVVARDNAEGSATLRLSEKALRLGLAATIALPLRNADNTVGVLRIYSEDDDAFSADEVKLLAELADDLAYGMVSLRTREERALAEQALRESEQRFRSISDSALDAIVMVDERGDITYWNPAAERMSGYFEAEVLGAGALERLVAPDDRPRLARLLHLVASAGRVRSLGQTIEFQALRRGGEQFPVEASVSAFRRDGHWQVVVLARDVSARKAAEEALHIRNRAIESSSNAIIIARADKAADNPIIYVNPAFERITGYSREDSAGLNPRFLLAQDWDQPEIERLRDALRRAMSAQVQLRNYRKDGSLFWAELSVAPVKDDGGGLTHYISVINDVTERVHFEQELRHTATHDQLTGLANRVLLFDRIEQAVAHASRSGRHVAVLLLDLDRFKVINDSLGHVAGDTVVRVVGERLRTCVRRGDTVARIGGDEFVVVLAELASADVSHVVTKIQDALTYPVELPGQQLFVTTSIGISVAPGDGSEPEALLRNADVAMYAAKDQGGSCFRFYLEGMNDRAREQLSLEADLRRAIERDEFLLHYQPKLDIRNGRIVGAEALIRWKHPTRGMVSPIEFIPLAEDTGLIVPIGDWAMRTACRAARSWQLAGADGVSVAVNISARQFRQGNLAAATRMALQDSGLDPACLELELTESMIMQNAQTTINALDDLKATGIKLSIDDFGTGYSSLSYLRSFPVDTLKIDRSFVKDLTESEESQTIAGTIVMLAHGLGMAVIAEGVETLDQLAFLRDAACDEIQGYLFSRPLPEADFAALLAASHSSGMSLLHQLDGRKPKLASAG